MDKGSIKKLFILCFLINLNFFYVSANYTHVRFSSYGDENYGIEACSLSIENNTDFNCSYYEANRYIPLNITKDYIFKVVPERIFDDGFVKTTFFSNIWLNVFLLVMVIFFFMFLSWAIIVLYLEVAG